MSSILTIIRQRRHRRQQVHSSVHQRSQRAVMTAGFVLSTAVVVLILGTALTYASLTGGLPSLEQLPILLNPQDGLLLQPTRLYDRTGEHQLAALNPDDSARVYALFSQLPASLMSATTAIAEPGFWTSPGYQVAGWQDPGAHPTLAQNLVLGLLLWDEPASPLRAIHERLLAAQVTAEYGRAQVLEWYLNSADYGHYAYGAEAAAQLYLEKSVTQIDLGEAALLASVSQAPALNPLDAPQAAEQRRVETLQAMLGQGLISADEAAQAILDVPTIAPVDGQNVRLEIAPAFVRLALSQLDAHFGEGRIERGGMIILTSLDYDLQAQSLCTVRTYLEQLSNSSVPADANCAAAQLLPVLQSGENLSNSSASALVLDPQTGQVLSAVGDFQDGLQGASLASHPAGTSIIPFIYLTGFSRGLNPASLGWDIPGSVPDLGQVFHGPVRLRTALANDYLASAITVLDQMGQDSVLAIAAPFGLNIPEGKALLRDDFDISPLTLAGAYSILADSGTLNGHPLNGSSLRPVTILKVSSVDHANLADWTSTQEQLVVSPQLAYLMNHVLSDGSARWASLGHPNPLEIGQPAGAKLSHSLDLSAAWTVGYTPQRVVVVWLGSNGQEAAEPRFSADLWHALIQYSLRELPPASWEMPSGIVTVDVCDPSGLLPTTTCPITVSEIFLEGRQPVQVDTLYQTYQLNIETGLLATIFTPPELVEARTYMVVPAFARDWAKAAGIATPPTAYDTVQKPATLPDAHITTPGLFSDGRGNLAIRGSAAGPDFVSYRLEFGQGLYPRLWTQIGTDSTTPVAENMLGEWDTTGLDGLYSLRLMVVRTDQEIDQAVVQVTLDNTPPQLAITTPRSGETVSLAQAAQIVLQAQANDPFLEKVGFTVDDVSVGELNEAPFGILWQAQLGKHTLEVTATDRAGNTVQVEVEFTVIR